MGLWVVEGSIVQLANQNMENCKLVYVVAPTPGPNSTGHSTVKYRTGLARFSLCRKCLKVHTSPRVDNELLLSDHGQGG